MNIDFICRILSKNSKIIPKRYFKNTISGSSTQKIQKIGIMKTPRRYGK